MTDFSTLIRLWYRQNGRILPWRETTDPYKIWLSEVILQQTRVDQGLPYFVRFTKTYPALNDLAAAPEDEVLNLWQGLGYYSRARNMHFAAKYIVSELNGVYPNTYKEILALKGVGEYTAAAIASFAFGLPHAVVDGNVYRVLSRYLDIAVPIDSGEGKKMFAAAAKTLMDDKFAAEHNQAIMEIGALVCAPKVPLCKECPINDSCAAHKKGNQLDLPVKTKKIKVEKRFLNYLVLTNGKSLVIKKRVGEGIWEGLYDFPAIEKKDASVIDENDLKQLGVKRFYADGNYKHILSHQRIMATFWVVHVDEFKLAGNQQVVLISELEDFPLPQLLIRYIEGSSFIPTE